MIPRWFLFFNLFEPLDFYKNNIFLKKHNTLIVEVISPKYPSNSIHYRSSPPDVFLEKGILKISSKFTGEHPCRSVILIKLQNNFIETTLPHVCFPVNLLHIFRTSSWKKHLWRAASTTSKPKSLFHLLLYF